MVSGCLPAAALTAWERVTRQNKGKLLTTESGFEERRREKAKLDHIAVSGNSKHLTDFSGRFTMGRQAPALDAFKFKLMETKRRDGGQTAVVWLLLPAGLRSQEWECKELAWDNNYSEEKKILKPDHGYISAEVATGGKYKICFHSWLVFQLVNVSEQRPQDSRLLLRFNFPTTLVYEGHHLPSLLCQ